MPRYYIDTIDGNEADLDREGVEFVDADAARAAAVAALPDMVRDKGSESDDWQIAIALRRADGVRIFTATLTMRGTWAGSSVLPWPT